MKKASTAGIQPSRAQFVRQKSAEALQRWKGSETDRQSAYRSRKHSKVQFCPGTVLLFAVSVGDVDELKLLVKSNAESVNFQNVDGLTPLHQACMDERFDLVEMLINSGARSNLRDNEGWTPLHVAAHCGNVEIARFLIRSGADVAAINNDGDLPLDFAEEEEKEDMINFLKKEIKKKGIDLENVRTEEERVMREHAQNWLYKQKIDETPDRSGGTALHVACAKGYLKVIDLLLKAGVDVNAKDLDGWSPIHAAAYWNQDEVLEILAEHGAKLDATDKVGKTAADIADDEIKKIIKSLEKKQKDSRYAEKSAPTPIRTNLGIPATRTRRVSITRVKAPNLSLGDIIQERAALEATKQGTVPHFAIDQKNGQFIESGSEESDNSDSETKNEPQKPTTPYPVTSPRRKMAVALSRPELPSLVKISERGGY